MSIEVKSMPKYERPDDWMHGEKKTGRQFMLTDTASKLINEMAQQLGVSRSEALERALRCGGMQSAKKFNAETGVCSND